MAEDKSVDRSEILALTAEIVAAHVGNNAVAGADVGTLIQSVFDTLRGLVRNGGSMTHPTCCGQR